MNSLLKTMPQATEVEKHVLGAMMLEMDAALIAANILEGADFYDRRYNQIFEAILDLTRNNSNIDAITVSATLKKRGAFDMAGGDNTLMEIISEVHTAAAIQDHAKIVKDASLKRKQIKVANWLIEASYGDAHGTAIQQELETRVFELGQKASDKRGLRPIREVLAESFLAIAKMVSGEATGLLTGLQSIDAHMAGMQPGDLIVLAGRPGQGKTSLGAQVGIHCAKQGAVVPFFECEMKDRAVVDRLLFAEANISHQSFKHGKVPESRHMDLKVASEKLEDLPFFINDSAGITPMQIRSQCLRLKRERGRLDLIIIDNIQRMKSDLGTADVRVRTGEISCALKEIAKEFNVPVIGISHLRRLANGEATEPTLADLQESGNIEQDADIVMALFNLSLYREVPPNEEGKVKLSFLKYREGSLGYVDLYFEKTLTTFMDWDKKPQKHYTPESFMGDNIR